VAEEGIPEEVWQLIVDQIDSVAQLEALLLLRGSVEEWTPEAVAGRLYIDAGAAAELLDTLAWRGFLSIRKERTKLYRYAPHSVERARRVDWLAEIYRQRLVAVTALIHERPSRLPPFADRFEFRTEH
jgi:hypothetical protein